MYSPVVGYYIVSQNIFPIDYFNTSLLRDHFQFKTILYCILGDLSQERDHCIVWRFARTTWQGHNESFQIPAETVTEFKVEMV